MVQSKTRSSHRFTHSEPIAHITVTRRHHLTYHSVCLFLKLSPTGEEPNEKNCEKIRGRELNPAGVKVITEAAQGRQQHGHPVEFGVESIGIIVFAVIKKLRRPFHRSAHRIHGSESGRVTRLVSLFPKQHGFTAMEYFSANRLGQVRACPAAKALGGRDYSLHLPMSTGSPSTVYANCHGPCGLGAPKNS
jgi:hypothetical protein